MNKKKSLWMFAVVHFVALTQAYRLPKEVLPNHYDLEIITNLADDNNNYDFNGKVWIDINCVNPTSAITLHSKSLKINENDVLIRELNDKKVHVPVENITYDLDNDFLTLKLKQQLKKGVKYELYMPFYGVLNEDLLGYYRSSYIDVGTKEKRWLATTQFEPTSARKAFPCFDEPAMKATFNISLGRKEKYSSISNMPIAQTVPIEYKKGWYWDKYEKSVPMSTYLVAYIVSDFDYKTSKLKENNISFRVWSRKDAIKQVEYANEVGPLFLQFFEKFFNIKYPLPKQDMIAIPDFSAGAMENWGLITYREGRLLYDPKVSSLASKESIASVIAHELAHQWFGNLVTMEWWSDLWLNEGFATYMSALALDDVHPSWRSLINGDISNLISVFSLDALESSHPVSVPVGNPKEIQEIFDTITYQKGSSVIRMMYNFLGKDNLRTGVSNYLEKHKYKNAEQDDLWESLTEQAHKTNALPKNLTVKTIMDSWTVQTGYPVISVHRQEGKESVELKQKRFISTKIKTKNDAPCWWVPISYTTQDELDFNNTKAKHWMSCPSNTEVIEGVAKKDKWFIFNTQFTGIYRVNYDENNWKLLIKTLNSDSFNDISLANRVQLIEDAAKLAFVGEIEYSIFFDLLKYLEREEDYLPWRTALSNMDKIETFFHTSSSYGLLRKYMRKLLRPMYKKVGGFEEPKDDVRLDQIKMQRMITAWSCAFEIEECINNVRDLFKKYQMNSENNPIPKDFRNIVYHYALQYGGENEWEFLWKQFKKSNVATEKSLILNSLGYTREIWLLQRYLEWSLDENYIRKQDSWLAFISVANNPVGYGVAKEFLETHLEEIHESITPRFRTFQKYLYVIAKYITNEKAYDAFKTFTDTNKDYFVGAKQSVEQSLEAAKLNTQWNKKHYDVVKTLLQKY